MRNLIEMKEGIILIVLQILFILAFGLLANYGLSADINDTGTDPLSGLQYSMFEDVQVIAFIGIGLLLAYLKNFMLSSLGFIFLIGTLCVQYGLICSAMLAPLNIDNKRMFEAETLAIVVLISLGAIHGKVSVIQQIIFVLLETPVYFASCKMKEFLQVADIGGGVAVHLFAAYFGLAAAKMLGAPKKVETSKEGSSYNSDVISMAGTMFLWIYWPSFNGYGFITLDGQQRAVINSYLALSASCVTAFAFSTLTHPDQKLTMAHIQNATLAGGVAISSSADLVIGPWAACLVGFLAGIVSVTGFVYVQSFLWRTIGLHDSCGIHNLHGMPSLLGSVFVLIFSLVASTDNYGIKLYQYFPGRSPTASSTEFIYLQALYPDLQPGDGRTAGVQAGYQLLWTISALIISMAGGVVTGLVMRISPGPKGALFDDNAFWVVELDKEEYHAGGNPVAVEDRKPT